MAAQNEASIWASSAPIARVAIHGAVGFTERTKAKVVCPLKTHQEVDAVRHSSSVLRVSGRLLPPRLLRQKLQRCDLRGVKLQPLLPAKMGWSASRQLPANLLFRPRSTRCLQLCHRKRCVPSRGKQFPKQAKAQNSAAWTARSTLRHSVPLPLASK